MFMFNHIVLGANDIKKSKKFYDATMSVLGYECSVSNDGGFFYLNKDGSLGVKKPINGCDASFGNGSTIGLKASSSDMVDAWFKVGLANGGAECEDPPGVRATKILGDLYLAYLRDPTGNKLCVVYRK